MIKRRHSNTDAMAMADKKWCFRVSDDIKAQSPIYTVFMFYDIFNILIYEL